MNKHTHTHTHTDALDRWGERRPARVSIVLVRNEEQWTWVGCGPAAPQASVVYLAAVVRGELLSLQLIPNHSSCASAKLLILSGPQVPPPFIHNCLLVSWPNLTVCPPFLREGGQGNVQLLSLCFGFGCLVFPTILYFLCVFAILPDSPEFLSHAATCHMCHIADGSSKDKRTTTDPWAPDWSARVPSLKHFQAVLLNDFLGTLQPCVSWVVERILQGNA